VCSTPKVHPSEPSASYFIPTAFYKTARLVRLVRSC
jgi:hypothetical protein